MQPSSINTASASTEVVPVLPDRGRRISISNSTLRRTCSPIILLIIWEILSQTGVFNPQFIPGPSAIFTELWRMIVTGELLNDALASLRRVALGLVISVFASVMLGALMARSKIINDVADPIIELIRPISPLAIYPLAILWFGLGDASKVFLIALSSSFPIILNTYAGVRGIDKSLLLVAHSLGASPSQIFFKVVLKGALPGIFTGVRLGVGISLIVIIATEMIGASAGLGFMVLNAQQTFRVDQVFAGTVIIGFLGFAVDRLLRRLAKKLLPWNDQLWQ